MKDKLANIFYENHLSNFAFDFIESSKGVGYDQLDNMHIQGILDSPYIQECIENNSLELGNVNRILLDKPAADALEPSQSHLFSLLQKRKSVRKFSERNISFRDLSILLRGTAMQVNVDGFNRRTVASAGGLYPVDIYVIALRIENFGNKIFHYNPTSESLEEIATERNVREEYDRIFMTTTKTDMDYGKAAGVVIFVGTLRRVAFKYHDRGVRYALIEAGELTQNFYLACAALDTVGCCACGGILEEPLLHLIGLGSADEMIANVVLFGAKDLEE
jgi:SagB-type dehydrogenase family enzyme